MNTDLLIQKYYKKELTSEEKVVFDDLLKNDTDFKKEVQFYQDLNLAIKAEERISLKKELQVLDAVKKVSLFSRIMIVASLVLLLSVGSYFIFKDKTMSNQELFTTNFEPYRNVMHPVIRGEDSLTEVEKAFVFYENGNFSKFIEIIKKANVKSIDYDFYLANAYLVENNPKEAILILENYVKNKEVKFSTKAHWYLGLSYLKLEQIKNAKSEFELVKNSGDFRKEKTIKLLKQLN